MADLISREAVLKIIEPRLHSAKEGSLEHQRLYSIYSSVAKLPNENKQKETDN